MTETRSADVNFYAFYVPFCHLTANGFIACMYSASVCGGVAGFLKRKKLSLCLWISEFHFGWLNDFGIDFGASFRKLALCCAPPFMTERTLARTSVADRSA